jgi:diadenosine tetraphosphate (Ap4A) HIT family hydrolase
VAYLHDDQFFPGWVFLVLKRHATELWQLAPAERSALIEEAARVARAVSTAFDAVKVNYELLGNVIAHIHWHLIPRGARDPAPGRRCGPSITSRGDSPRRDGGPYRADPLAPGRLSA